MIPPAFMAEAAQVRDSALSERAIGTVPRHSALVRITHWITAAIFLCLLVSGIAILLAQPRLYWGETGARDGPSLIDLPLPFVLDVPIRGPGRYLHFLAAWICAFTGLIYVIAGVRRGYFRRHLLPAKGDLNWRHLRQVTLDHLHFKRPTKEEALTYNLIQRLTYLLVIFVLFPLVFWTGFGMSPAITSVLPWFATLFGGQQSARTMHFFVACILFLFFVIHLVMVGRAGFTTRVRAMITGHLGASKEHI